MEGYYQSRAHPEPGHLWEGRGKGGRHSLRKEGMTEENRNAFLNEIRKKRLLKEAVREGDPEVCSWRRKEGGAAKSNASASASLLHSWGFASAPTSYSGLRSSTTYYLCCIKNPTTNYVNCHCLYPLPSSHKVLRAFVICVKKRISQFPLQHTAAFLPTPFHNVPVVFFPGRYSNELDQLL